MKKLAILAVAIVAVFLATRTPAADVEGFHKTWAEAKKAAEAAGKPIYLHFTTTWCGWCRKIEKDVYANPEGKEALKPFVAASLDCTVPRGQQPSGEAKRNLELMRKWGGGGYPFLVMVSPDGAVLNSFAGYKPVPAFKAELTKARATWKEYRAFESEAAKADTKSYEYNAKAMALYAKVRKYDRAAAAAEKLLQLDPKNEKGRAADAAGVLLNAAQADGDEKKAQAALALIKKHDPRNDSGVLERSVFRYALATFQGSRRLPADERNKRLKLAIAALTDLTGAGVKLTDAQNDYHLLGFLHSIVGGKDKARAALQKALAADPDSRAAAVIRKRIQALAK
jgi:thioredoxin-related protein